MSRKFPTLLLVLASGCSTIGATTKSTAESEQQVQSEPAEPETVDELLARVQELTPRESRQLTKAIRILSVNCPYTRASLQLPLVMHAVVSNIDAAQITPDKQADWQALQKELTNHVAALDGMGVDLRRPTPGDHLHKAVGGAMVDRSTLAASRDPIGDTRRLVDQNNPLVDAMDPSTQDLIRANTHMAYPLMGPTSMYRQIGSSQTSLQVLAPFVLDEAAAAEVEALIALLDAHNGQGC